MTTPKENGFFMPSEWHTHTATWMAWPGLEEAYIDAPMGPEEAMKQAKVCYGEVARTIARFETVNMLANKESIKEAKAHCGPTVPEAMTAYRVESRFGAGRCVLAIAILIPAAYLLLGGMDSLWALIILFIFYIIHIL